MKQRIVFEEGKQKEFLDLVKGKLNAVSLKSIMQFGFEISYTTLKDYYNERILLPRDFFEDLCYLAKLNPRDFNVSYKEGNWGQIKGGKIGIREVYKKYPEEIKQWRQRAQKNSPLFSKNFNLKSIKIPELDEKLAEFIGAYLGDGNITEYQIKIAGDYRYDYFYFNYLSRLVFELFGVSANITRVKKNNTSLFILYSKNICTFLHKNFGINYGHKINNKTIIPPQILNDEKLSIACLRGLMDTDGSVSRRGRKGSQFCLQFTSHNPLLLNQVTEIGKKLHLFTFFDKTGTGTNKWENIQKYFKIVGSSNPKHIIRFLLRKEGKTIYRNDLDYYFKQDLYKDLNLPFILGA